jgi:integrase
MRFPVKVRHRKQEATIYGRSKSYDFYRVSYYAAGRRIVKSFPSYSEALKEAKAKVRELAQGNQTAALSAKEAASALAIRDALGAFRRDTGRTLSAVQAVTGYLDAVKLLPEGFSLTDAVRTYLRTVAVVQRKPLSEAVNEFAEGRRLKAVAQPGKRPTLNEVYVKGTERILKEFSDAFPGHHVCDLTKAHIDAYLSAKGKVSPKTRNHHRATLRMFLGWCQRRDYLSADSRLLEADGLRKEPLDTAPTDFYKPSELRSLLENADRDLLPVIALQALAGLRLQEVLRMDWSEVFGIPGHIEVTSAKSKTRQRRLVEVCPSLEAWLQPFRGMTGKVWTQTPSFQGCVNSLARFRESLKIRPRRNGLRRGFASYHYAMTGNENETAAQLGSSPQMVHSNYRGLATKAEAMKWFAVAPAAQANVIPMAAAAAK